MSSAITSLAISGALLAVGVSALGDERVLGAQDQAVTPVNRPVSSTSSDSPQHLFLRQHCLSCHNERLQTANLVLDRLDLLPS